MLRPTSRCYVDIAEEKGLIDEVLPLGYLRPVIAVPKGNPKEIESLDDLLGPELRVALGNPESASVGKLTTKLLEQAGIWEKIKAQVEEKRGVFKPTVPEIANDVKIGAVDAAIVWDATVAQQSGIRSGARALVGRCPPGDQRNGALCDEAADRSTAAGAVFEQQGRERGLQEARV